MTSICYTNLHELFFLQISPNWRYPLSPFSLNKPQRTHPREKQSMQINQPSTRAVNVLLEVAPVAEGVFPAHDANRERERNEDEEYGDPQEYPYAADYLPHGRPAVDEPSERHGSHRDETHQDVTRPGP